jgi:MFS family permease
VFLAFVFAFELGSLICGVASSSVVLIVGRAIAGLGASGIVNGAMTILSGAVPREKSSGEQRLGALMVTTLMTLYSVHRHTAGKYDSLH